MRIQVFPTCNSAHHTQFVGKTVIILDVFRTSTTIISALEAGAASIIPTDSIAEAKKLKKNNDVLGGERFCKKIAGFDLGNSPAEYNHRSLEQKKLILTTTNATRVILRAAQAKHLIIGCLTNLSKCVEAAIQLKQDIVLLCVGCNDQFTIEDGYSAGAFIVRMQQYIKSPKHIHIDDFGYAMLSLYQHLKKNPDQLTLIGLSSKQLKDAGYDDDLSYCLKEDLSSIVPIYLNGELVRFNHSLDSKSINIVSTKLTEDK